MRNPYIVDRLNCPFVGLCSSTQLGTFAVLLFILAMSGTSSPGQREGPLDFPGSVQGHIICNDGGFPARNAHLTLTPAAALLGQKLIIGSLNSSSDFNGNYSFHGIPPGDYVLNVRLAGYIDDSDVPWSAHDFSLLNPERQKHVLQNLSLITVGNGSARHDVVLRRGGAISGHVFFDNAGPLSGGSVSATPVREEAAQGADSSLQTSRTRTITDDRGAFRIAGLPKGKYRISVTAHRDNSDTGGSFTAFAPGTLNANDAKLILISEGDEIDDTDITVPLNSLHSIGGFVTRGGTPFTRVALAVQDNRGSMEIAVHPDGSYRIDLLPAGTYTIQVADSRPNGEFIKRSIKILLADTDILDANLEMLSDAPAK